MPPLSRMQPRLLIIDDDLLSREVLTLLATEYGFMVQSFPSGEAALAHLIAPRPDTPLAILIDMQMPDLSGDALAHHLHCACGSATLLIAMSGTPVPATQIQHFDAFLLKPFTMRELAHVIANFRNGLQPPAAQASAPATSTPATPAPPEALSEATYQSLAESMSSDQLMELYTMCLDDAERRAGTMRQAATSGDAETFLRGAHSIKGCCGMVGALELARLAAEMEENGIPKGGDLAPFEQFMNASSRLRRMLISLQSGTKAQQSNML